MIKALAFAALLIVATIFVVMSMDMNVFADDMTAITMGGAIAIATITAYVATKYIGQIKTDTPSGELADENWDGIGEYKNELPSGWAYSFLAVFLWSMWYGLIGYPVNGYSSIGEYNEEVKAYNAKFEKLHQNISVKDQLAMGESIYLVQCSQCHGNTGDGLSGKAEDFTQARSKEEILDIIANGQNELHAFPGGMPGGMAQGATAEEIATYMAGGFKGTAPASYGVCAGCHGANGEGVANVGPRINGYDVMHTLAKGKKGKIGAMPAFDTLLNPTQQKAVDAYIQTLVQ
jgi:cytochrome c oxidase cbb3-type subunit 3